MSLINDALKRAGSVKPADPMMDADAAPLHPAQVRPTSTWLWYSVALMLAIFLATSAILIGLWTNRQGKANLAQVTAITPKTVEPARDELVRQTVASPTPELNSPASVAVQPQPASGPGKAEQVAQVPALPPSDAVQAVPLGASPATTAPVEPVKPVEPTLKLQAIFYRASNPAAMINARTLRVGDKILGARITAIERESVTLERNGEKILLELQMQ